MPKLDKAVVLYFPAAAIGTASGARCGRCWKFIEGGMCVEVEGEIDSKRGVCGLYVEGPAFQERPKIDVTQISKKVAGYIEKGPSHCGGCEYYGAGTAAQGPCAKVEGIIDFEGCCNAWEEK
jgi:hypothetical protein